ncbi:MFS transporter [Phytoactinopolyspora alkaliphila]|uniref:MFS transporter n=1 Tax=Phytoactinopolyspora alkaliphila TaxID=1783498 RepID=A0A6N9YFK7_9ACTN|nr:MFS transporter [Phytoactinopolyspora alkaliphila]NED93773.1 MFS transporter [Phytoactinopolyspora alkaliphila]
MTTSDTNVDLTAVQRRTVSVLVGSQVAGGLGVSAAIAVGAVLVTQVFGREDLSGLVQSSQVLGAALLAMPAAALAVRYGRRAGLGVAYALGALGAVVAVVAAQTEILALLLIGTALLGGGTAAGLQARYAATDLAPPDRRGRALSVVVWSTTVGAVVGPNLAGPSGRLAESLGIEALAGPFLVGAVVMAAGAVIVVAGLRPDPLVLARSGQPPGPGGRRRRVLRTGWTAISGSPRALFGLTSIVVAHTVMVSVMVMTPVHMSHGGASISIIGFVISVHVAGMFAFSPIMGWLADRVGRTPVVIGGVAVLLAAVALSGTSGEGHSAGLTAGLFLLGLGWSACLVAASTLLTDAVAAEARPAVQGASDLLMGLAAAGGGALAGVVVGRFGYDVLNMGAAVVAVVPLVVGVVLRRRVRRAG